jgi:hypothetical protein
MPKALTTIAALSLLILAVPHAFAESKPVKLSVEPAEIKIADLDQSVQLLVTLEMSDGSLRDVTRAAQYTFEKKGPELVAIDKGYVTPKLNGSAALKVTWEDARKKKISTTLKVSVEVASEERVLNFTNDVIPILTKAGCNAGGCHGKSTGQNGFSLSLLGFEPDNDYDALVREGRGRRLFPAAPDQSLLLKKAIGQPAHGGGARFTADSHEYQLLRRWIEQGMPKGNPNDPKVQRIEVLPRERILAGTAEQQLRVMAYFTDNSVQDVTRQAEYKSQQPDILKVEHSGTVATLDRTGEGA